MTLSGLGKSNLEDGSKSSFADLLPSAKNAGNCTRKLPVRYNKIK
jgi:hypothetical protein